MLAIWAILFGIIIIVSFFLALRSMHDYHEMPLHSQTVYSLFLIKNEIGLTDDVLKQISEAIGKKRLIISFERLFKGSKKALVIYGPQAILEPLGKELDLTELEDYSLKSKRVSEQNILSWEVSSKFFQKNNKASLSFTEVTKDLSDNEELWWQLILQPRCDRNELQPMFKAIIRVAIISENKQKSQSMKLNLDKIIKESGLVTLPQAYSSTQVLEFYQQRSLPQKLFTKDDGHFMISSYEVKYLLD